MKERGGVRYTHNKANTCIFWCEKDSQSFPTSERVQKEANFVRCKRQDGRLCRGLDHSGRMEGDMEEGVCGRETMIRLGGGNTSAVEILHTAHVWNVCAFHMVPEKGPVPSTK